MSTPAEDTGRRAVAGAAVLVARGSVVLCLGLGANIVLARLLEPRDFGLVALGTILLTFGTFLADGGLGSGLIRREEPPTGAELRAVNAFQLTLTAAIAALVGAVGLLVGHDGLVIAAMVAGLPVTMLKVPSVILLERRLDYRVIAKVDLFEAVVFYAWAVTSVALGAGVWGFATAVVARAVAGAAAMLLLGPAGFTRPRWSWKALRPLVGFAAKFQASVVVALVRDQSLNVGIAAIAGIATLGVWNLAYRVLQIPLMVFGSFGRIGFPAMARMLGAGQDPRSVVERGGAAVAVLGGTIMVALVGFAPALPVVLGPGWEDVPAVLLWAGLALIAHSAIAIVSSAYLFASDAGGTVATAAAVGAVIWLGVALPLVPVLGAPAAGVGWCAGAMAQLTLLGSRTAARSGAAMARRVVVPAAVGVTAAAAGWLAADAAGQSILAGAGGVLLGEAILLAGLLTLSRDAARDTRGLVARGLGSFLGGRAAAQP